MSRIVLLDAGPLGLLSNPRSSPEGEACDRWLKSLATKGVEVKIPEIADYEVRRELLRADKMGSIEKLNNMGKDLGSIPLSTETMLLAAYFWAQMRKAGKPTADNKALDCDVILAAQAANLSIEGHEVVIATTNVKHLSRLVDAKEWKDIS